MPHRVSPQQEFTYSIMNKTRFRMVGGHSEGWTGNRGILLMFCFCFLCTCVHFSMPKCLYAYNQIKMSSSPESHWMHGVGSWGDLATDQDWMLKEAFVWDCDNPDQIQALGLSTETYPSAFSTCLFICLNNSLFFCYCFATMLCGTVRYGKVMSPCCHFCR